MGFREDLEAENAPLLRPITPEAPGGVDASFLPEFEAVKAELDKLGSMAGTTPDWAKVLTGAEKILATTSKDFRLLVWLAVARVQQSSFRGLASGLVLLVGFVQTLWEKSFPDPRRARGRANLYAWYTEQIFQLLEQRQVAATDRDAVTVAEAAFTEFDTLLSEKLGDAHPGPGRIRTLLRNLVKALPAEAPPPVAEPSPSPSTSAAAVAAAGSGAGAPSVVTSAVVPAPPPVAAPPAPAGPPIAMPAAPAAPTSVEETQGALREVVGVLVTIARLRRKAKIDDPVPYRMLRDAIWVQLEAAPDVATGQRTRIRAPAANVARVLEGAFSGERWPEVIEQAEEAVRFNVFWLDPHRFAAMALERLGHTKARDEIARQLVRVTKRVPQLLERQFENEQPFASPQTLAWIEGENRKHGGGGGGSTNAENDEAEAAFKTAQDLAAQGRLGDGLHAAVEAAHRSASGRERFRSVLRAGRLAFEAGAPELARPMLEGLLEDVQRYGLEVWDPALCVDLYRNLIQALRAETSANVDRTQREALLFEKLCRLDPRAALLLARR